jgi:hypothetical protein
MSFALHLRRAILAPSVGQNQIFAGAHSED